MVGKVLTFLLASLFLYGCATMYAPSSLPEEKTPEEMTTAKKLRFSDVPVPKDMVLDVDNSFIFETELTRVGLLKYSTRIPADELVSYFKQELPLNDWNLVNILEYGRKQMVFEKGEETLIITIYPERRGSRVIISLTPRQRID